MKTLGSAAAVIASIQEDARTECDRVIAEADRLAIAAGTGDQPLEPADRELRLLSARREAAERVARAEWLDMRAALEARERWMTDAAARGRRRLLAEAESDSGPALLAALAAEATAWLHAVPCDVIVEPCDASRLDERWRTELMLRTGCTDVRVIAGSAGGGCIVRTRDGRASFDNTWDARDRRFAHEWRAAMGRIYERTSECHTTSPAA